MEHSNKKPIILIGMMGGGKSHIGRLLAKDLNKDLYDLDHEVECSAGLSISEIFELYGEKAFRDHESKVLLKILSHRDVIISTGGGAVLRSENLDAMLEKGIVVWIKTDAGTIYDRVKKSAHRPLLQCDDPKEKIIQLLAEREAYYSRAHIEIDNSMNNPQKTLRALRTALDKYILSGN